MSANECRKIEKQLNSILRNLASGKNDASSSVNMFPLAETYEENFPAINHSPHKFDGKYNSNPSPQAQNSSKPKPYRTYKPMKRNEDQFYERDRKDFFEHGTRRRNDYMKPSPQKVERHRNFDIRKQVIDRKHSDDKLQEFDSNLRKSRTLGSKLKDKEIHVLSSEDMELERNISADTSKKSRNFKHSNKERKEQMGRQKSINDDKIQAKIFRNALPKTSVSRRDKKVVEDKGHYETEGITCINEDETNATLQYHTESCVNADSNEENRAFTNSDKKIARTNTDKYSPMTAPNQQSILNRDEFITRCNKQQCSCSEGSLYCTLCDFHVDNQRELEKHRKQISHEVRKKDFFRVKGLKALNPPSPSKLAAIEELLQKIYVSRALGYEDGKQRRELLKQLTVDLSSEVEEDCTFHLFGSSINGFGHKDSNVNIDLEVPQGISPSKMLLKTFDALKDKENKYGNISNDFYVTYPVISFIDHKTKLACEITLNNDSSRKTSNLLKQYAQFDDRARKLGVTFCNWAKICEIDQQEFCSLPSHAFPLMVIYFLQQTQPPVLPVLHEMVDEKDVLTCDIRNAWKSSNKQTLGELWMDLFKFYSTTFQFKTHVICICQKEPLLCKEKKWTMRMMCIEDPYHTKRNLARTIANPQWFQYILECIRSSFEYFFTCKLPQAVGEVFAEVENSSNDEEEESGHSLEENSLDICFEDQDKDLKLESVIASINAMDLGNRTTGVCPKNSNREMYELNKNCEHSKAKDTSETMHYNSELENMQMLESSSNAKECIVYKFEKSHLINAKRPVLFCRQCQKPSHVKKNCSIDDNLPELKKLPKMDQSHKDILTELCQKVFSFCKPSEESIQQNILLLTDLQKHIQYVFRDAQLELFGSSCNGFGFGDSDLDICLTFYNKTEQDFDQKEIIERLTKELNKHRNIRNILPIPTAKVPIIKFSFLGRKEGDISLYNTLGQHNTRLLSTYCKIDQRVQLLGYSLKYFAKKCDICDASRGSLSSYAYILMTIFYLQQLEVPVIPVLQELYDHNEKAPERYVDNWNTWFFEDISQLSSVWQDYGKNRQCLGELWMGLLIFYTEKFRMTEYVISIRQKAPLTRFEKLWNTRSIAIEDPFDLSHNLGAGISGRMNSFILAVFRRGRELCGRTPPARRDIGIVMEYFFNTKVLTGGEKPPNERGCRICSKIGHKMKECPLRHEIFRKRHFERRNSNDEQHQTFGNFKNRHRYIDRNQGDRRGVGNARGTFRKRNFHNSRDHYENKRTVDNYNQNIC